MTRIEKAVKIVSDLYDFYRQIPKIPQQNLTGEEKNNHVPQPMERERVPDSSET